jgi:hypothetical protein
VFSESQITNLVTYLASKANQSTTYTKTWNRYNNKYYFQVKLMLMVL